MPDIVLAHDYLVQMGGAERVVVGWAAGFGSHRVVTLAYRPEATFEEFRGLSVQATIPYTLATQVERMLPLLPSIAARTRVSGGDVALVSSSGWAHRFRFEIPHVVYVHSPARWLHATDDYLMRLSPLRRAGLHASEPLLRRGDLEAMARARALVANSAVTQQRIRSAYGLDSVDRASSRRARRPRRRATRARAARRVRGRRGPGSRLQERATRRGRGASGEDSRSSSWAPVPSRSIPPSTASSGWVA